MLYSGVLGAPHGWSPPSQVVYDVTIAYDPPALPRALFKEFFQGAPLDRRRSMSARVCVLVPVPARAFGWSHVCV